METNTITPGSLRSRRNQWLLDLKLELQRIIRDHGKCLKFNNFGKTMWIKLPTRDYLALVYSGGDITLCDIVKVGEKENPNFRPGLDISVFDNNSGISISELLDLVDMYPKNPFE